MIIKSDLHIHSEFSYDATLPLEVICESARELGFNKIGITDHLNYNDTQFIGDLTASAAAVKKMQEKYPFVLLGVELTPIELPEFEYAAAHGTRDGYIPPKSDTPYPIELGMTKEELMKLGVRYAIGASHWRVDIAGGKKLRDDLYPSMKEWYRQQLYLATDERVTILGHPWYNGKGLWYEDFSIIPRSMNEEIAAALKENGKYAECNRCMFDSPKASERFKHQYAEFLRELFERGIKITYGSDSHSVYDPKISEVEKYLSYAGFKSGDLVELADEDLW